jgi:hypothetical protein
MSECRYTSQKADASDLYLVTDTGDFRAFPYSQSSSGVTFFNGRFKSVVQSVPPPDSLVRKIGHARTVPDLYEETTASASMTMAPVRSMQVAGEEMDSGERGYAAQRSTGNETWWDERLKPNGSDPTGGGQTAAVRRRMDFVNGRPPSASPSGGLPGNGRQTNSTTHDVAYGRVWHMHLAESFHRTQI